MYTHDEIRIVHLEVTSKCNARCPMCPRNIQGGPLNRQLPIRELSLADATRIFVPSFLQQLRTVYLCGNFGDPAIATDCLAILQYFRRSNPALKLGIHTNGGLRPADWWRELATEVNYCQFAIDGLEDTNHLYRQGVNWGSLMRNAKAFVEAGGVADWVFLVFKHNQHQIDAARQLSQEMGFRRFVVKTTSRFPKGADGNAKSLRVLSPRGEPTHLLEPTDLAHLAHPRHNREAEIERRFGSQEAYLERCPIQCKAAQEKSVFIDAGGNVLPCCWTAGELYASTPEPGMHIGHLLDCRGGEKATSALERSVQTIVDGELFQKALPEAWQPGALDRTRLPVCAKMCGDELLPFEGQYLGAKQHSIRS